MENKNSENNTFNNTNKSLIYQEWQTKIKYKKKKTKLLN